MADVLPPTPLALLPSPSPGAGPPPGIPLTVHIQSEAPRLDLLNVLKFMQTSLYLDCHHQSENHYLIFLRLSQDPATVPQFPKHEARLLHGSTGHSRRGPRVAAGARGTLTCLSLREDICPHSPCADSSRPFSPTLPAGVIRQTSAHTRVLRKPCQILTLVLSGLA